MNDYQNKPVDTPNPAQPLGLAVPDRVRAAMAEIVGNMEEGPLALVVGAGLQVMQALRDADVTKLAGPKGRHHSARTAARRGTGSRVAHPRASAGPGAAPSVPAVDGGGELDVPASEPFSSIDLLGRMAIEKMLTGLSARTYPVRLDLAWTGRRRSRGRSVEHQQVRDVQAIRGGHRDRPCGAAVRGPVWGWT